MEENVNEVLGIEKSETVETKSDSTKEEKLEINHSASNGLSKAATFCDIMLWIGLVMAFVAAIVYLNYSGDLDSYSDYTRLDAVRICAIAGSCFTYGIAGAISCFITSKFLRGIGTITKAAEHYLGVHDTSNSKSQAKKETEEKKWNDVDLSAHPIALYKSKTESFEVRVVNDEGYGVYECVTLDGQHTYHFRREVLEFKEDK